MRPKPLRDRVTAINEESKDLEAQAEAQDAWVREFLLNLPNLPHESVPLGASSDDNPVVHTWGEAPGFDFPPRPTGISGRTWASWILSGPPRSPGPASPS